MIIVWIILWIIAMAFVVGVFSMKADAIEKKDSKHKPYGLYERFVKRGLDAFLATGALIVLSPILIITAILVRVKLGFPILFTQERPGRDGVIFRLYKFRTMTDARDENGELLPDEERFPAFGQKLRSTSLDGRVIIRQTTESLENKGFREVSPLLFHRGFRPDSYNAVQSAIWSGWCQSA